MLILGGFLIHTYWTELVILLGESWRILRETRIRYFTLAFLVYILSVYLFAVRWQNVLSCMGYDLKAKSLVPVIFGGIFANNLTPASRTGGEPLRIFWVKKQFGISYTNAFISILFERLVEAIPIVMILIYVLYSFPLLEIKFLPLRNSLTLNSTYLLILTFLAVGISIWGFRAKLNSLLKSVQKNWRQLKKSFIPALLLSSGVWVLDIIRLKLIALALNLPLSLHIIATVSILYLVLGSLPITPGGLGIVEGGLISILLYFGLPLASASSFVFLERFISFGLSSLIGFLYLFYYGGFKIWKNTKSH
ncbi:lysylphosphatidylglycerol synthase transmembrane domain-containing protein [Methanosarcina sp.]|uniref:lysylphosphatidylglycerol synthase transmembrane domain-containing protein n=1 Tax=Methanosarcina sp. TaxID=2213 RepID=UPI003BB4A7D0